MLNRFLAANRHLCTKLTQHLPQAKPNIFYLYEEIVSAHLNARPNQIVVDIGGGNVCPFASHRDPQGNSRIIAVDVSMDALIDNLDVDEKIVIDTREELPFRDDEVDMVVSRSVLEHLENPDRFVMHSHRILRKNGYFIHLFPSKFALFALINRMLPRTLSKKMLYLLFPESKGIGGFPAFYNKCYYSAMKSLLEKNGFELIDVHVSYFQSGYFGFFVPLFVLSSLYEIMLRFLRIKNLSAYLIVVAKKK
ncbi:MAG TPA: class I SAM-dependent methyltransferase [Thermodesulfovibrionales bacterium]|nr:class I SAM-dependent methyltransferase [Thermodesulfovibrionales bacterium]